MKVELLAPVLMRLWRLHLKPGRMLSIWAVRNLELVPMLTIWIRNS